jgi:hypothetical protein
MSANLVPGDHCGEQTITGYTSRLQQRQQERNDDDTEMRGSAGIFLTTAMQQCGIGDHRCMNRTLAPAEPDRCAAVAVWMDPFRRLGCDRSERRWKRTEANSKAVK